MFERKGNWLGQVVYLTKDRRKQMNDLAIRLNNKIKETISKLGHSDKIVFVDVDPYVRLLQGRFCESGIEEPAKNRPGLLFYNRGTSDGEDDDWDHNDLKRNGEEVDANTFEGQIASKFENAMKDHPDWKLAAEDSGQSQVAAVGEANALDVQGTITTFIPDTIKRVFHPRPYLHGIYAQLTLFHIANDRSHSSSNPYMPQVLRVKGPTADSCKWEPVGPPRAVECFARPYGVAKEDTGDVSSPVMNAIKRFCKNHHGERATADNFIYDRWDISGYGIPKRQSMWIRASPGSYAQCGNGGRVWERDCVNVLTGAMNECDKDFSFSHGFKAQGENCLEYMADMSANLHEDNPPWKRDDAKYPPPETVKPFDIPPATDLGKEGLVDIYITESTGQGLNWDDANQAINEFCNNDQVYTEGHKSVRVGDVDIIAGPASFWVSSRRVSPYEKEQWCQYAMPFCDPNKLNTVEQRLTHTRGVDLSKKNTDDCKYGFQKLFHERKSMLDSLLPHEK